MGSLFYLSHDSFSVFNLPLFLVWLQPIHFPFNMTKKKHVPSSFSSDVGYKIDWKCIEKYSPESGVRRPFSVLSSFVSTFLMSTFIDDMFSVSFNSSLFPPPQNLKFPYLRTCFESLIVFHIKIFLEKNS